MRPSLTRLYCPSHILVGATMKWCWTTLQGSLRRQLIDGAVEARAVEGEVVEVWRGVVQKVVMWWEGSRANGS